MKLHLFDKLCMHDEFNLEIKMENCIEYANMVINIVIKVHAHPVYLMNQGRLLYLEAF